MTMNISKELTERCGNACEMCQATENLSAYAVPPKTGENVGEQVALCPVCFSQMEDQSELDIPHWRCLNDSIWNVTPAVQVVAYRMLKRLSGEGWAQDLLDMMYLEDSTREWADNQGAGLVHKDSNGHILADGDTVTLIKDLNVKGANFTAKRGAAVRRIRLVADNAGQIEGKVNGQQIVILTEFVKKQS